MVGASPCITGARPDIPPVEQKQRRLLLSDADGVHVVPTSAVVGDINTKESNENDVVLWVA
jgi:hypothetical protein